MLSPPLQSLSYHLSSFPLSFSLASPLFLFSVFSVSWSLFILPLHLSFFSHFLTHFLSSPPYLLSFHPIFHVPFPLALVTSGPFLASCSSFLSTLLMSLVYSLLLLLYSLLSLPSSSPFCLSSLLCTPSLLSHPASPFSPLACVSMT